MRKRLKTALNFINHYETKSKLCEESEERSLETTKALPVTTTQQCINISKSGSLRSTNSFATPIRFSFSVLTVRMECCHIVEHFLRRVSAKSSFKSSLQQIIFSQQH